jgi:polyisoprenyl-teichoic acid--peptidoglycan teichoic acid transferase
MRSRFVVLACLLLLASSACGSQSAVATSTPAPQYLVTVPADATPTPTPFQPATGNNTPISTPVSSETPTSMLATFDPNSILSVTATPESFYVPSYAPDPVQSLNSSDTVSFLLLGSDKRVGQTYFRTDTIVIALVRPNSGQVALISVPRDLYVYIPTVGMDRINTAYEYGEMDDYPGGGTALLKDTILYNLGLSIDHLAVVDFDGFRKIVDTLGGVDVPVYCPYTDWHLIDPSYDENDENSWSLYTVGPGVVHMDGDLALWYARSRQKSSDFDRGRRSQEVLRALYKRALQTDSISKIPELYNDFNSAIITDLTLPDLVKLSPLALHLNNADIRSYYIGKDLVSDWMTPGGASVLLPDKPAIQSMLQQVFTSNPTVTAAEKQTIEVRNGTSNSGWDDLAAEHLNYIGYNTRIAAADRQDYVNSWLYNLGTTPDLAHDNLLLAALGLPQTDFVSAPMQVDVNYVFIVGADYQPCFNPDNLSTP